jgi:predicted HicB family RNase H-like nuclease
MRRPGESEYLLQLDGAFDTILSMNRYTYRAEWSDEHGEYAGRCIEFPSLSRWAPTLQEAIGSIERAVDELVSERQASGDHLPAPLTERQHSGKFVVRTSPALHARLAVEAAEQNVSMNQWVVQKLSGSTARPTSNLFDFD